MAVDLIKKAQKYGMHPVCGCMIPTFSLLIWQAILEQELRPYFDGKWKGLGDPHLTNFGKFCLILSLILYFYAGVKR